MERIDIEGNATTLDRVIRSRFTTIEGDPYNPREIRDAAARIRALGFFSRAEVEARDGSTPDQVVIDVDVEEQPTGSLAFGASYSTDAGLGGNITFSERNFLGRGQALSFAFDTTSDTNSYRFRFLEPLFLGRDVEFGLELGYQATASEDNADFGTSSLVFRPSLSFPLGEISRFGIRYSAESSELADEEIPESDGTGDTPEDPAVYTFSNVLDSEQTGGEQFSSAIGYTYGLRTLDSGLNPDAGVLFRVNQDLAGLGGDAKFIKTTALFVAERELLNRDVTVRAILEGGMHHDLGDHGSRYTERFSLTGRMRGFEVNGTGPRDYDVLEITNETDLGSYSFVRADDGEIWTDEGCVDTGGGTPVVTGEDCLALVRSNSLRGNYYAVAKFETEFPLGIPEEYGIRGGAFLDIGSVWGLDNQDVMLTTGTGESAMEIVTPTIDDGFNPRVAAGVSLFWGTPIGPLRFNFSKALVKEDYDIPRSFDLTVSTRF